VRKRGAPWAERPSRSRETSRRGACDIPAGDQNHEGPASPDLPYAQTGGGGPAGQQAGSGQPNRRSNVLDHTLVAPFQCTLHHPIQLPGRYTALVCRDPYAARAKKRNINRSPHPRHISRRESACRSVNRGGQRSLRARMFAGPLDDRSRRRVELHGFAERLIGKTALPVSPTASSFPIAFPRRGVRRPWMRRSGGATRAIPGVRATAARPFITTP